MAFSLNELPPRMQKQALAKMQEEDRLKQEKQQLLETEEEEKKRSKYRSSKVTVILPDGTEHTFDSRKEARRYEELLIRQKAGEISDLCLQKKFILIPAQREPDTVGKRGGIIKGKVIEREVAYFADFCYTENGNTVVEDVKSPITRTPLYKIKKKMMLFFHGIRIKEV